jgi:uncharacterized RDD family membrane protein YckC
MSAITILDSNNAPTGPFTRAQVADKLQRGEVTLSSLAFVEGLAQWTPLSDVLKQVDAANPPPAPAPAPIVAAPLAPTPGYSYAATMEPPAHFVYAGFWIRLFAYLIDGLVIFIAFFIFNIPIIAILVAVIQPQNPQAMGAILADLEMFFLGIPACWLYFALQESGSAQATLGKRMLGLRVTDMAGQRIGFGRASGRFFAKIISAFTFYIGFIMAGFTDRKQALHDMIAGTLVVRNS